MGEVQGRYSALSGVRREFHARDSLINPRYWAATGWRWFKNTRKSRLGLRRVYGMATWRRRMLPRFIIIGGQKAGTTALFDFLCRHPGVAAPERFEIHYFDVNHWRGLRWYLSHFPPER